MKQIETCLQSCKVDQRFQEHLKETNDLRMEIKISLNKTCRNCYHNLSLKMAKIFQ